MAVFLLNNCKFDGCGQAFPTLGNLIQHIENSHIETDPPPLEQEEGNQPSSLALSYILKYFSEAAKKDPLENVRKKGRSSSPQISFRSATPTGSEFGDDEVGSDDEDSDDSYTTQEEFTTELILGMMSNLKDDDVDKPFACPVPGCKKRYKNVNGIKYHARHGHRRETRVRKAFKCKCGKSYKTAQGLRNHMVVNHPSVDVKLQAAPLSAVSLQGNKTKSLTITSQDSGSPLVATNQVFMLPTSVAQTVLTDKDIAKSGLSLVPVTLTTSKSSQGQITLVNPTTIQLINPVTSKSSSSTTTTG